MKWMCKECQHELGLVCQNCGAVGKYEALKATVTECLKDHQGRLRGLMEYGDPHSRMAHAHHGSISAYERILRDIAELESVAVSDD